jgi:cell volume regulation protein A
MRYQEAGRLVAGDHVYIFVSDKYPRLLDKLFASRGPVSHDDAEFFGSFALDPDRPAAELEANYGPGLGDAEQKLTIGQLMQQRLGGRAEYADRLTLGEIELIVRDVDDNGKILSVGLSFEPSPPKVRIPAFLSPGEMADNIRALLFGRPRGTAGGAVEKASADDG